MALPHIALHPGRITIDTAAVEHNMRTLISYAPQSQMMAVVKANAYGHGFQFVIPPALQAGASWLGVAQLDEALTIRAWLDENNFARPSGQATPQAPRMLAWIFAPGAPLDLAINADIDLSVSGVWALDAIVKAAARASKTPRIHLKIDTGLSRSGATLDDFSDLVAETAKAVNDGSVELVGLWSHFSSADEDDEHSKQKTASQLDVFAKAQKIVEDAGLHPQIRHIAASSGILFYPQSHFEMVRAGIAMYGYSPNEKLRSFTSLGLRPAMTLTARAINVKRVHKGAEVSYNGKWVAPTDRWLAVVPLGYADGIPRIVAGEGYVWAAGEGYPIVGTVCMDQVVIDLGDATNTDEPPLKPGATITFFGPGTHGEPTAVDWAQWEQTITYEVTTRLSDRIPRKEALRLSGIM